MGAALAQAWKEAKIEAIKQALTIGCVLISFRKMDGTVTTRKATSNMDLIRSNELVPDPNKPRGGSAATAAMLSFYSETDHAWRSFRTDNLIRFKAA